MSKIFIPWVEKYRPINFDDIVLDPINRQFFHNMNELKYFPNLLFYGPPGTGKTTTIISLINRYNTATGGTGNAQNKGLVLHLNASDDRGIDVIRNQINQFVNSRTMFETGMKFVILDEVDYMTKNAQQALRYLLQSSYTSPVRFCLICNYISKIEYSLKNEFICIRFNQLPPADIYSFIKTISEAEKLNLTDEIMYSIQKRFNSDIRSMINFLQTHQDITEMDCYIINENTILEILKCLKYDEIDAFRKYIYNMCAKYNIDKKELMKECFQYLLRGGGGGAKEKITGEFLDFAETVMHSAGDHDEFVDFIFYGGKKIIPL